MTRVGLGTIGFLCFKGYFIPSSFALSFGIMFDKNKLCHTQFLLRAITILIHGDTNYCFISMPRVQTNEQSKWTDSFSLM